MGLDITYGKNAVKLDCVFDAYGEPIDPATRERIEDYAVMVYSNPDFPGREEGLEGDKHYTYERSGSFRAGSYGGYNAWREQLAELAGYPIAEVRRFEFSPPELRCDASAFEADSGPFWEHICFSDCEGFIGPVVSAKLAKDYAEHQEKANAHTDERFRELYEKWRKAFEAAAENGFVWFH